MSSIGTELKRRLWLSLAYPILDRLHGRGRLFFFVCVILVEPVRRRSIRDFGIPLPRLTIALIVDGAGREPGLAPRWSSSDRGQRLRLAGGTALLDAVARRSLAGRLPLVGRVWRATSLAEFCHLLALLLESRLALARSPPVDRRRGSRRRRRRVVPADGQPASSRAGRSRRRWKTRGSFPPGFRGWSRWAENQESLPEVLHMAGAMFEARGSLVLDVRGHGAQCPLRAARLCTWSWSYRRCSYRSSP